MKTFDQILNDILTSETAPFSLLIDEEKVEDAKRNLANHLVESTILALMQQNSEEKPITEDGDNVL